MNFCLECRRLRAEALRYYRGKPVCRDCLRKLQAQEKTNTRMRVPKTRR